MLCNFIFRCYGPLNYEPQKDCACEDALAAEQNDPLD